MAGTRPPPVARDATPLEVYNIPLFEIPPMLDVRSAGNFSACHPLCAVPMPAEDGESVTKVGERILAHDDQWGWCLQHPLVIVHDHETRRRAEWLVEVLEGVLAQRAAVEDFGGGASRTEQLLRRLAFGCRQILLLLSSEFAAAFPFCCQTGWEWGAASFFDRFGPLPRCALLQPSVFLAGRQVRLTKELLELLAVTHMVVNADWSDVMDGTSGGGGSCVFTDRSEDVRGIRYLKCDIADRQDDPDASQVLHGAADFIAACAGSAGGGCALIRLHGQSRSAAVACAYLVKARGLPVEAAWGVVARASVQVDERLVWWGALRSLEAEAGRKRPIEDGAAT